MVARRDWVTTAQVAQAAGVHQSTLGRWQRRGLLPQPVFVSLGKRGRSQRWPPHAIQQAAWIKVRLEDGWTFEEIAEAVARGVSGHLEHQTSPEEPSDDP